MMEASYYKPVKEGVKCYLCPHNCLIPKGRAGICKVRKNENGKLTAQTWGRISSINLDPVEKKPLYHFFPGRNVLSIGSTGCNMKCKCCQNWQISQTTPDDSGPVVQPLELLELVQSYRNNIGIAYTYNEPSIWTEFILDTAVLIRQAGFRNIMVSNGYINEEPLRDLLLYIDAFNIDLKGFSEDFYHHFTGSSLAPILRSLKQIRQSGRHLEITSLIIPEYNDDIKVFSEMIAWIAAELGTKTVLHLSRYHPAYKINVSSTSQELMEHLLAIARKKLFFVYAGNIFIENFTDTLCSNCKNLLVTRNGYRINIKGMTENGLCSKCGNRDIIS